MSVIFAILMFTVLIFLHELGHFITAKLCGIQVNEFALFMGPAIWKKQIGETLYSIRCIPFGGYCAMEGEDDASDNPRSFQKAAWWKRLIVLVAGAAMNFLTGLVIYACLFLPESQIVVPQLAQFDDCCIFHSEEGLMEGDLFLEIDGEKIYNTGDVGTMFALNPTGVHDLKIRRGDKILEFYDFPMTHTHEDENGQVYNHYGIVYGTVKDVNFLEKLGYIWDMCIDNVRMVRLSLQMLLTGQAGFQDMSGPVGIVSQMTQIADQSETTALALLNLLSVAAFIAINLAVMNLLPLPALDGGRVVCLLLTAAVEGITRKKIDPKYEGYLHSVGLVLLLGLMVVILFKDIFVLFTR